MAASDSQIIPIKCRSLTEVAGFQCRDLLHVNDMPFECASSLYFIFNEVADVSVKKEGGQHG